MGEKCAGCGRAAGEHAPRCKAVVDEYGEIDRQMEQDKPRARRHEALKKLIASWFDGEPAAVECVAEGNHYTVPVSARRNERTVVSMARLFRRLGRELFLRVCRVPLEAVEQHLAEGEREQFLTQEQSGARTVGRAVAKAAVVVAEMPGGRLKNVKKRAA